jgi:hypothetical protein
MNERHGRRLLEPWMTAALETGEPALRSFVTGLPWFGHAAALAWHVRPPGNPERRRADY